MAGRRLYPRLGELIDHMIRALALVKGWPLGQAMAYVAERSGYAEATIYRWRQGRLRPPDETLELLARLGHREAGLDRIWGEAFLSAARYPDVIYLADEIWGPNMIRSIPHNLPPPAHTAFFGRQEEMARLLELLSPSHAAHLISVDGIGGVGKTALVLEAAYRCLRASTGEKPHPRIPTFEAIIFTSAKQQYLTSHGILARYQAHRTLRDIFREIAYTLNRPEITRTPPEEQLFRVRDALARQRVLLIVDNLETIEDQEDVLAFLYDLPSQVKVVITTRRRAIFSPIRLEHLPEEDGLRLIRHEAHDKGVILDDDQALALYRRTGGIPAAIVYALGQMAAGYTAERVLERVAHASGDVARFCFEGSVAPLRGKPAHHLLMSIAMFPKRPLREAVVYVAGLTADPIAADEGLAQLQYLSLVSHWRGRYAMLPLTREYALAELAAHPEFEQAAQERWVAWYLDFAKAYGGYDWEEWHVQYDRLEEEWTNLVAVFDWCAAQERYEVMKTFWVGGRYVDGFSNLYGHWEDRLTWLDWLIQAAERRGDWSVAVEAMSEAAWTLILMGQREQLEKARKLLEQALLFYDQVVWNVQIGVDRCAARYHVRQRAYSEAHRWLDRAETLLEASAPAGIERTRQHIPNLYWRAVVYFEMGKYERAAPLFQQVLKLGQVIGWQRAVIYAQNWLADIAIVQGNLEEAERLLHTGLPVAERNKDRRRIAFFQYSLARLEQGRGDWEAALHWARQALDGFERLGMQPEAEETQKLVQELLTSQ